MIAAHEGIILWVDAPFRQGSQPATKETQCVDQVLEQEAKTAPTNRQAMVRHAHCQHKAPFSSTIKPRDSPNSRHVQ